VLLTGTVLFVLLLAEATVRIVDQVTVDSITLLPDRDRFWKSVWLLGEPHSTETGKHGFQHDPLLGWVPLANYHSGRVSINAAGIRGTTDYLIEKPAGVFRIAVFGDSFAFGEGVSDDQTFASLLEESHRALQVLNFAVPGYGTDQMYLRYQQSGIQYRPDLVLQMIFVQDIHRDLLTFRDYGKPIFRLRDGTLVLENTPVPDLERTRKILKEMPPRILFPPWHKSHLYLFLKTRLVRKYGQIGGYGYDMDLTLAIAENFLKAATDHVLDLAHCLGSDLGQRQDHDFAVFGLEYPDFPLLLLLLVVANL